MAPRRPRLPREELLFALAGFAAVAAAYAEASDEDVANDEERDAALRDATMAIRDHVRKQSAERDARAVAAITATLHAVYARVAANARGESERDGPSSRRTQHEGAWYTDEQRVAVLQRAVEAWLPGTSSAEIALVDLPAIEIAERGGAARAAAAMASQLLGADAKREAQTVSWLAATPTVTFEGVRAFVDEALRRER